MLFRSQPSETVLDAAGRQGHAFTYSCRSGSCGSCKAKLLSGEIEPIVTPAQGLSEKEAQAGMILLCQARPKTNLIIEATELPAGSVLPIRTLPCRITELKKACHDVMIVQLKLPQNQEFQYLPGQYIDILLRDGRRRSFSIANLPDQEARIELHVRLVPGGHFSQQVFSTLKARDLLRFQGPFGTFFLREDDDLPAIMVAGGTGLAPIKAILESAFARSCRRTFHLFWGVRDARDLYLHEQLNDWASQYPNFDYTPVLSEGEATSNWMRAGRYKTVTTVEVSQPAACKRFFLP